MTGSVPNHVKAYLVENDLSFLIANYEIKNYQNDYYIFYVM